MKDSHIICSKCVMDTTDAEIYFDEEGVCNHCRNFENELVKSWFPNDEGDKKLKQLVKQVKIEGEGKQFDCIVGLSGGVDSSYLALKMKEWGLRPLVVHVDAGWNSELAVSNIQSIVDYCCFDLHTEVINWSDMRALQLAYLRSGIPNQDVPQDHIFFSTLYHFAVKHKIKFVFSGGNIATEGIFPSSWHGSAMDSINLKSIFKKFGVGKLNEYKTISFWEYYLAYPFIYRIKPTRPLNLIPYNKQAAIDELERKTGWRRYKFKHGESLFTKLFQNYLLPERFGFDKRKPHYSSLIVSGQMSRKSALKLLKEPLYDPKDLERDIEFFCKKLKISIEDFSEIMKAPRRSHNEFQTWTRYYKSVKKLQFWLFKLSGLRIKTHS